MTETMRRSGTQARVRAPDGAKVMVIDDSEIAIELITDALTEAGCEVVARNTAVGAQAAILRARPDLVLVDVQMPLMSGEELVRGIRAHGALKHTLVILCSARPRRELEELVRTCDADGCVSKDDVAVLAREVAEWLTRGSSRDVGAGYVLVACGGPRGDLLADGLRGETAVRLTTSGHEALRWLLSSEPPIVLVVGTALADLPGDALLRAATRRDPKWSQRAVVLREDGSAPGWSSAYPAVSSAARLPELLQAVERKRAIS